MKLLEIQQSVRDAAQSNLVVSYIETDHGRHAGVGTYIISDVRALSPDEFKKLADVSFEQYQLRNLFMVPMGGGRRSIGDEAWNQWEKSYGKNNVTTIKWKELVAKMNTDHPTPRSAISDDFD